MRLLLALSTVILTSLAFIGCGHKEGDGKSKGPKEEPPSGASFKAGKGVLLQVETTEVSEQRLPREVHFTAQVFGEVHAAGSAPTEHTKCVMRASGLIASGLMKGFAPGQPVTMPVETLWLIELRATKGGAGCTDGH